MSKNKKIVFVVSSCNDKTIIVAVQKRYQHLKYKKILIKTKRFMAHDETNISKSGDLVLIEESRPFSKNKKWILKTILKSYLTNN